MKKSRLGILLWLIAIFASAIPLAAQVRVEFGVGWSLLAPALKTSYLSTFSPPMTGGAYTSSASQLINVKGKIGYGLSGIFNLFVGEHFGGQILVDYFRPSLGGTNPAFTVALNYTTFGPRTFETTDGWPDTRGDFTEATYSFNAIVRFPLSEDVSLSVSGGPTSFYLKGKAMPLGFWSFRLENPEVNEYQLFLKSYQLVYDFGPMQKWGFNAGAEVAFAVTRNVIVSLDVRRFQSGKGNAQIHLVANGGLTDPIEPIEAAMDLGSLRVDPSYFRACATLRFVF